ncbi:hypothetical protein DRP53_03035 [candidate division WOR-3 bacterium]|uniref:4Fe-4S ferredoxin-type domain-containing protein n=1 Tax=candidate division WOR-3 bacterium TaxID=2052148 RepID=A0A660SJJ8_UNCW3|nr:MAG: hypothetical protein DRP53_03035 [candidate division WOR-3 bacterium]
MEKLIRLDPEIQQTIIEYGGGDIQKCYQCGRCMPACPWNLLAEVEYPVFRYPQAIKVGDIIAGEGKEELERETADIFRCVGCESCLYECPRGVNIAEILRAVRRILVEYGSYPGEYKDVVSRLKSTGNPLGEPPSKRGNWAVEIGVPSFDSNHEYLYSPCCIPAYDRRGKEVARATSRLLMKAGVSFGTLGPDESCCGEAVRRIGAESVFQDLMRRNREVYTERGVKRIITSSPHCQLAFERYYQLPVETYHITQLLDQLIQSGRLRPTQPFERKVVYHDPCTLGRQLGIYEEPRRVLMSIPGLELLEVPYFNRGYSICCGGGSLGLWYEWSKDERLCDYRIRQIVATGAEVIAVACPYCLQMFEETLKSMDLEIKVMDITEILNLSVE